jgi:hypothetical protein
MCVCSLSDMNGSSFGTDCFSILLWGVYFPAVTAEHESCCSCELPRMETDHQTFETAWERDQTDGSVEVFGDAQGLCTHAAALLRLAG